MRIFSNYGKMDNNSYSVDLILVWFGQKKWIGGPGVRTTRWIGECVVSSSGVSVAIAKAIVDFLRERSCSNEMG
jgi:hypothetical protein